MSYKKDWVPSPNFTPASQTQAAYGRPRSISGGAGHWWNWPRSGARHDGIVSYMANRARQAAPHAVLSAGRVTEMVRDRDTAWCTANANPYTFAIEIDPRIMFKWGYDNPSAAEKQLGNQIFETLCEYIADKGYHNLPWKPHNVWSPGTQCNPIKYGDVMARAKAVYKAKHAPKPTPPTIKWVAMATPRKMVAGGNIRALDLNTQKRVGDVINKGTVIDFATSTTFKGATFLRTKYSTDKKLNVGIERTSVGEVPAPQPEWIKNLKTITPTKLTVLPAAGTNVINLNDLKVISPLGKGTVIDFVKSTTVKGKQYLISKYSSDHAMPNGILRSDVGVPVTPPAQEKPTWLTKWQDIANVTMYTRVKAPLVDLLTGKTIKEIPINTPIEVGSTTEWLDGKYAISEYSTGKKEPRGILIVHLDNKPIEAPKDPLPPAPTQPTLEERVGVLEKLVELIRSALAKIGIKI